MAKITVRPVHQMALFSAFCLFMLWSLSQPMMSMGYSPWYSFLFPILLIFGINAMMNLFGIMMELHNQQEPED